MIPAVVTAGGRIDGAFAEATGVTIKALAPLGQTTVLHRVLQALSESGVVTETVVVGPRAELVPHFPTTRLLDEGQTGIDNLRRGLRAIDAGDGFALIAASDVPFLSADAVRELVAAAPESADIVFPIVRRTAYEAAFPNTAGTWTRLADGELTGASVLLVRPAAIERNAALIERTFAARKSQWEMARLLGLSTAFRFALGRLSVRAAEARASAITGCRCHALMDAHPHLACDIDTHEEYLDARRRIEAGR